MEYRQRSIWELHFAPLIVGAVRIALLLALVAFGLIVVYEELLQIRARGCTECCVRSSP
jgi:uncharacterized protein (DUF2062 family)